MYCDKIGRDCKFFKECNLPRKKKSLNDSSNFFAKLKMSGIRMEVLLYNNNLKNLFIIEDIKIKDLKNLDKIISSLRIERPFYYGIYSHIEKEACNKEFLEDDVVALVISNEKYNIRKMINYHTSLEFHKVVIGTGKLLGYPNCCIKNAVLNSTSIEKMIAFEKKQERILRDCPLLGNVDRLYTHFPCSSKCKKTISIAEKLLYKLSEKYGKKIIKDFFDRNLI